MTVGYPTVINFDHFFGGLLPLPLPDGLPVVLGPLIGLPVAFAI